jgi:hypothetical protein
MPLESFSVKLTDTLVQFCKQKGKHRLTLPIEGLLSTVKDVDPRNGDLEIEEVSLSLLKDYLAKQSERLKPSRLGHRIRFVRSLFRFAFEEGISHGILPSN